MEKYFLGNFNGENIYLTKESRDCGRYRGCGYIGNNDCHMHLDGRIMKSLVGRNVYGEEKKEYEKNEYCKGLATLDKRWEFLAIRKAIYHFREHAKFLRDAGNIGPLKEEILQLAGGNRVEEIKRINEIVLPELFRKSNSFFN